ncbi:MAG: phosphate ABC transporter permease subunit PstC [Fimbriimonadaceae bacterium]|nr:phosphate ABC transporter permease subunit PstC [Fimbriimonadaceae bacterium]
MASGTRTTNSGAGELDLGRSKQLRERVERLIGGVLGGSAALSIAVTVGIVLVLAFETIGFFREVSPLEFFFGTQWHPLFEPPAFGVLPLVCGTVLVTVGSSLIAVPLGLGSAFYLAEYATESFRRRVKPILELLAGVPTVVYGYFAVAFVTPFLQRWIPSTEVFNAASACVVVGIMILPTVASLCDDAFRAVPRAMRDGAYGLGATRFEVSTRIVFPAALSGVLAAIVLALSRAIGETMAVTLAAGSTPKMTLNPLVSIQAMTGYMVQISLGDNPYGTVGYRTLFAVGTLLFGITLVMNMIAQAIMRRFREEYE